MRVFQDSMTMFKRCMMTSLRNPETIGMAIIAPAIVMWIFATVFGGTVDVGADFNFIDFIVPGILLQTVAQAIQTTAISVNNDIQRGVVDRFRSMPIAKSALLTGHVTAGVVRNILTTAVVIGVAFAVGFRPQASFLDWLAIAGIIILFMVALTWVAVFAGVKAKAPENTTGSLFLLFILPFLSSGFTPTENLPSWLQWFAQHQPMTPVIDALRGLMMNTPTDGAIPIALAWSAGITIVAALGSVHLYKRKMS